MMPMPIGIGEQDGRGLDADFDVVLAVDHGVDGVEDHDPEHIGDEQQPGQAGQLTALRGEGHGNTPAEGQAQEKLRHVGMPLHVRIQSQQRDRDQRQ